MDYDILKMFNDCKALYVKDRNLVIISHVAVSLPFFITSLFTKNIFWSLIGIIILLFGNARKKEFKYLRMGMFIAWCKDNNIGYTRLYQYLDNFPSSYRKAIIVKANTMNNRSENSEKR